MADGTRLHLLAESVKECQDALARQTSHNTSVQTQLTEVTDMLRTLLTTRPNPEAPPLLDGFDGRRQPSLNIRDDRDAREGHRDFRDEDDPDLLHDDRRIQGRTLQLDFPHFDGDNPSGWSYKVNQFFDYYQTPLYQRVRMASFHMEGEALVWFQDADEAGQFPTWDAFLQALLTRFGPVYEDPMESLVKLRQTTTVTEYTSQFEALSNRLRGISDKNRLSCFLSGLKDEIRLPLRMLNPVTLAAAFGLAKLQEYILSTRRSSRPTTASYNFSKSLPWSSPGSSSTPASSSSLPLQQSASAFPIQKLFPAQMKERRDNGLCYNCDEKWNSAHKCKSPKLYLMQGGEPFTDEKLDELSCDDSVDGSDPQADPIVTEVTDPEISLHAIAGTVNPNTMRLIGWIKHQRVVVLFDSGSTHNFLDPTILPKLFLPIDTAVQLQVRVANGARVTSAGRCYSVSLKIQGHLFTADFYVLPLGGCDVVLGVKWLRTLGPVLRDFQLMTMAFNQASHCVTLQGLHPSGFTLEDGDRFLKPFASNIKEFFLQLGPSQPSGSPGSSLARTSEPLVVALQSLLSYFGSVFDEPAGLP
jgi:hypothetical protein